MLSAEPSGHQLLGAKAKIEDFDNLDEDSIMIE